MMARLLLIDDDPDQVEIRRLILERAGHQVATAGCAHDALKLFADREPEVVITDLRLPRSEDGLFLLRELRARSASVRILVLSGWPEDLTRSDEASLVNHCLRKPVRSRELLSLINRVA